MPSPFLISHGTQFMEKKSRKGLSSHGRLQTGCVSGLINMLDFRRGRSTRRLLSDRQPSINQNSAEHVEGSEGTEEPKEAAIPMIGFGKTSVKELMEEDMLNEEGVMMSPSCQSFQDSDEDHPNMSRNGQHEIQSPSVSERDDVKCSCKKLGDLDVTETSDSRHVLEIIEEHLAQISAECLTDNSSRDVLDVLSAQAVTETDKKLMAAVKLLMERKLSKVRNFEEENPSSSGEFMDAIEVFTANYTVFLELLKSVKVTAIKTSPTVSNILDCELGIIKADGYHSHKQLYFLRKKRKSLESLIPGGKKGCHSSLVGLKPGSLAQNPGMEVAIRSNSIPYFQMYNSVQDERHKWFKLSFTEIKRKLWHSMLKEKTVIPSDKLMFQYSPRQKNRKNSQRHGVRGNMGWSSPNRNHFYTERFTLSSPIRNGEHEMGEITLKHRRVGGFDIDNEAKKHIAKMLTNVDENIDSMTRQMPKPFGRILHDSVNDIPSCSNVGEFEDYSSISECGQNLNRQPSIMGVDTDDDKVNPIATDSCIPFRDDEKLFLEEIAVTLESQPDQQGEVHEFSGSCNISTDRNIHDAGMTKTSSKDDVCQCLESTQCSKPDFVEEGSMLSSSDVSTFHSSGIRELGCDHAIDKLEQPSPVSVLESLFMDDASSPASILSEPGSGIEHQHIIFEEQCMVSDERICTRISMEDEESPFEYVEAVLLGSGLDWNEFHVRWLSSQQILDSSLFEEVELFSNRSRCEQKLLFDCANEALLGVCNTCFSCFTCKERIGSFQSSEELINEIWRQVEWYLFHQVQANSLDQLVRLDLARSGKWMNFQPDIELLFFEFEETVLDELLEDTILSFEKVSSHQESPPVTQDESVPANDTIM